MLVLILLVSPQLAETLAERVVGERVRKQQQHARYLLLRQERDATREALASSELARQQLIQQHEIEITELQTQAERRVRLLIKGIDEQIYEQGGTLPPPPAPRSPTPPFANASHVSGGEETAALVGEETAALVGEETALVSPLASERTLVPPERLPAPHGVRSIHGASIPHALRPLMTPEQSGGPTHYGTAPPLLPALCAPEAVYHPALSVEQPGPVGSYSALHRQRKARSGKLRSILPHHPQGRVFTASLRPQSMECTCNV